ncbi:unnamed protein product (mitochondrion) [Plasmodiophora brassicae]|uniref:Uncharacterized protein n=1 Tax=Plasmodiophora brassicae TaxID=37360 RepID=A0A0G4J546_PLABS|nr:hypothetical protein PBRA_002632 [Plasmodiophora brassicae]SPQ94793.1 unnamed protein product [Plasmodiophora brassicae]
MPTSMSSLADLSRHRWAAPLCAGAVLAGTLIVQFTALRVATALTPIAYLILIVPLYMFIRVTAARIQQCAPVGVIVNPFTFGSSMLGLALVLLQESKSTTDLQAQWNGLSADTQRSLASDVGQSMEVGAAPAVIRLAQKQLAAEAIYLIVLSIGVLLHLACPILISRCWQNKRTRQQATP